MIKIDKQIGHDAETIRRIVEHARARLGENKAIFIAPDRNQGIPRYWDEAEGDDGIFANTHNPNSEHWCRPCEGCGEHRLISLQEVQSKPLVELHFCPNCRRIMEAEAAAERGEQQ